MGVHEVLVLHSLQGGSSSLVTAVLASSVCLCVSLCISMLDSV